MRLSFRGGWGTRYGSELTGPGVRSPSFHQLPGWPWGRPFPCMSFFLGSLPGPSLSLLCARLHPQTPCQQELDQVLERISTMRLPDERGPLEHLYSLHIPNCDKNGLYNLKQVRKDLPKPLMCLGPAPHTWNPQV